MYWENLELPWQEAFSQGWIAYCHGSVPIGSVITDQNGEILTKGRNHINEKYFPNNKVTHAETIAVQLLDLQVHRDPGSYIVYACAEPCPMCLGTIVMGNIRTIRVAAKDAWSGATDIAALNSYVKSKNMKITFEAGLLGAVQITMQSYFDLKNSPERSKPLLDAMSVEYKHSVLLAKELLDIHYFEDAIANNIPFRDVFDNICTKLTKMNKI